jgi:hypothetical protein
MPGSPLLLAVVVMAASAASISLTPLLAGAHPSRTLDLVETSVGTTVFCASIGLIFHRYGVAAGFGSLLGAWIANRVLTSLDSDRMDRISAWASAAALLFYLSRI